MVMRVVRFISALVVATGLAMLPVGAAMAMGHASKAEAAATTSGDDCPCCDVAPMDGCPVLCCHLSALFVGDWAMTRPSSHRLAEGDDDPLTAFVARPDPPPPRS
jgi:hypothetical protein